MRSTDHALVQRLTLECLAHTTSPVGSPRLVVELAGKGIVLSEATAGRVLRSLDRAGWTTAHGKRGRLLSDAGRLRLRQLQVQQRRDEQSAVIVGAANPTDIDELIDLLYVRRAVEPEAARHAALRATDAERDLIRAVAASHVRHVTQGTNHGEVAIDFHRLVAQASHNKMLIAVASLVVDPINDPLSRLLDVISVEAGAHFIFAHEHEEIVRAFDARDADAAEAAMRRHIDDLIGVVERYRERFSVLDEASVAVPA